MELKSMCDSLKHHVPGIHVHIFAPKDFNTVDPQIIDRMKGLRLLLVDALEEYASEDYPEAGFEAVSTLVALGQQFLKEMKSPAATRVLMLSRTFNRKLEEKSDGKQQEDHEASRVSGNIRR